jgi:signal transduction histidine kinase
MGGAWSISLRLFGSAAVWIFIPLAIALLCANFILGATVVLPLDDKINADLEEFIQNTEFVLPSDDEIDFKGFTDDKYHRPGSGWFAQITAVGGRRSGHAWRSKSFPLGLESFKLSEIDPKPSIVRKDYSNAPEWALKALTRKARHPLTGQEYYFTILADVRTNIEDTEQLNNRVKERVILVSIALIITIIIGVILQIKFGLKPLSDLKDQIVNKREGRQKSIDRNVAREIKPISEALNNLFDHNDLVLERARSEVGNLSHSLKTPISIIKNEAGKLSGDSAELVSAQIENIERHVMSYLDSARNTVLAADKGMQTAIAARIKPWSQIIRSSYADKEITFTEEVSNDLVFNGSQMHLDDILQNLIENACKWCKSRIHVTASLRPHPVTGGGLLSITIEDDGPGIPSEMRQYVVERGNRGDEKTPGSGLGLDIVRRITTDYGGEMDFSTSDLGGLSVTISLPGTRK